MDTAFVDCSIHEPVIVQYKSINRRNAITESLNLTPANEMHAEFCSFENIGENRRLKLI